MTVYVTVALAEFPARSTAVTVMDFVPSEPVSMGSPFATVPSHCATPDRASAQR